MKLSFCVRFLFFSVLFMGAVQSFSQIMPRKGDSPYMPEDWLFGSGQSYHLNSPASGRGRPLGQRDPTEAEMHLISEIEEYFDSSEIKILIFMDGDKIVRILQKPPVLTKLLLSASIGKSVTAISAGVAVCEGRLSLDTKLGDVVPKLAEKDIGKVRLIDFLTMRSGARSPNPDSTIGTIVENQDRIQGRLSFLEMLAGQWGDSRIVFFSKTPPGQYFEYKSTDPLAVGMMVAAAYGSVDGKNFATWQKDHFFPKLKTNDRFVLGRDHFNFAQSDGNVRLSPFDWIRFAIFVRETLSEDGCMGEFVRAATKSTFRIDSRHGAGMRGYGYFFWLDNVDAPDSFWAQGYGGQFIGWSKLNNKMIISFSTQERASVIHKFAHKWFTVR